MAGSRDDNAQQPAGEAGVPGWRPAPGVTLRQTLRGHRDVVFRIAWSPDGKRLASPSRDNTIRIWDPLTAEVVHTLQGHTAEVLSVAWSPDRPVLASAANDNTVRLWDVETGEGLRTLQGHSGAVNTVAWSPDGRRLASGSDDQTVKLWDAETGEDLRTLEGHSARIFSVAWSPGGRRLASASGDTTVRLWDADSGEAIRTLEGHAQWVGSVAWFPEIGTWRLASSGGDKTIRIWHADSGRTTNVLEGHTRLVKCVAFSGDGRLLASKGRGHTIRLWRCDTWQPLAVIPEPASPYSPPGVAFHPHEPLLATVGSDPNASRGESDKLIHIWQLDPAKLLGEPVGTPYTTAKIVLVGDSGVGKTGLAWRLAHGEFKEHASTHGQQFWVLDQVARRRGDGTQCEAVLWDLAGQPDYRLIHALFLDDADLALVLFDPTDARNPLGGAEYWLGQLPAACPKILVAARVDRGGATLTGGELDDFCRSRGIAGGLVETSALDETGLDELLKRMQANIDWDAKTATSSTETFKRIKDLVLELKADRAGRKIVYTPEELRERLSAAPAEPWQFSDAEMITAVERLASHGYVQLLKTSDGRQRVLLVPERLNNLAASFVLEARRNPKGLGALEEQRVLTGGYRFSELDDLEESDRELLLDATIAAFLENRLSYRCFREILGETRLLVFPELMNQKRPQTDGEPTEDDVSYSVTGASENTYAAMVVLLGYANTFLRTDQWHNQARYEFQDGLVCGFRQSRQGDDELVFELFYGTDVGPSVRAMFQGLFESFLDRRKVTVRRFEVVECGGCGHRLDCSVMRDRLAEEKDFAHCNECGRRLTLPSPDEPLRLRKGVQTQVDRQRQTAERRALFEQAAFQLHNYVRAHAERMARPTCFVSYAWGNRVYERWVEQLTDDLQKGGLEILLDCRDNARVGASILRFVDQISECDRVLVVGTPQYLEKYKNRQSDTGSIVAAEMDQIGNRILGTEGQKTSVVPLLLSGSESASFPRSLRSRVYKDFRETDAYFLSVFELLLDLYGLSPRHEAVADWFQRLARDVPERRPTPDGPEFSDEQLRAALPEVGRAAREAAFRAGQPVTVLRDGKLVSIDADGTERVVEP